MMYEVYFADLESQKGLVGCDNLQEAVIVLNKNMSVDEVPSVVNALLKDLQAYLKEQIKKPLLV